MWNSTSYHNYSNVLFCTYCILYERMVVIIYYLINNFIILYLFILLRLFKPKIKMKNTELQPETKEFNITLAVLKVVGVLLILLLSFQGVKAMFTPESTKRRESLVVNYDTALKSLHKWNEQKKITDEGHKNAMIQECYARKALATDKLLAGEKLENPENVNLLCESF